MGKIKYAQLLHNAYDIRFSAPACHGYKANRLGNNDLNRGLPVVKPGVAILRDRTDPAD